MIRYGASSVWILLVAIVTLMYVYMITLYKDEMSVCLTAGMHHAHTLESYLLSSDLILTVDQISSFLEGRNF